MRDLPPLSPSALCRRSDPASFAFDTTADLPDVPGIIGQERAEEARSFGRGASAPEPKPPEPPPPLPADPPKDPGPKG